MGVSFITKNYELNLLSIDYKLTNIKKIGQNQSNLD